LPGDVNPLRHNLSSAGAAGGDALRNVYDQRGGRGGNKGGQGKQEPEPSAPAEEPAEEERHLDADSFKGGQARQVIDQLFSDALPWEQQPEDGKLTRLELLQKLRDEQAGHKLRGSIPPARKPVAIPPRPGGTGPLGGMKVPALPQTPTWADITAQQPTNGGRRVDENFDPTAGVNSTLLAQQEIAARAALRPTTNGTSNRLPDGSETPRRGTGELPGLAKLLRGSEADRGASDLPPRPAPPGEDAIRLLSAPLRHGIEFVQEGGKSQAIEAARRATAPLKVRPPRLSELHGGSQAPEATGPGRPGMAAAPAPGALARAALAAARPRPASGPVRPPAGFEPAPPGIVRPPAGKEPARPDIARPPAGIEPARPDTVAQPPTHAPRQAARVDGGLPAHAAPRTPAPRAPREAEAPIAIPDVLSSVVPASPATPAHATPAAPAHASPTPSAPAPDAIPGPSWLAAPEEPTPPGASPAPEVAIQYSWPGKPPKVKAGKLNSACTYRVIDVGTNQPLAGARIELEPVRGNSMLPSMHGQVDGLGWYGVDGLSPGEYRVTVRSPGYVPVVKVRHLEPGVIDDLAIFIAKP
jgi:hypothetical protein